MGVHQESETESEVVVHGRSLGAVKLYIPTYQRGTALTTLASLQEAHGKLARQVGFGGFLAYEVITDLRHKPVLWSATDIQTWCHFGPGAVRGMHRLFPNLNKSEYLDWATALLHESAHLPPWMPKLEMRDIEHCLCEYDKYMRVKLNEGRPRSRYNGGA